MIKIPSILLLLLLFWQSFGWWTAPLHSILYPNECEGCGSTWCFCSMEEGQVCTCSDEHNDGEQLVCGLPQDSSQTSDWVYSISDLKALVIFQTMGLTIEPSDTQLPFNLNSHQDPLASPLFRPPIV